MQKIYLTRSQWEQMEAHVRENSQEESCGLLGGNDEYVRVIIPVTNQAHSSARFFMDPAEMVTAMLQIEQMGLEMIGTYHSHLTGPDHPSQTDIFEYQYPGTAVIIWLPDEKFRWDMKAFLIQNGISQSISFQIFD